MATARLRAMPDGAGGVPLRCPPRRGVPGARRPRATARLHDFLNSLPGTVLHARNRRRSVRLLVRVPDGDSAPCISHARRPRSACATPGSTIVYLNGNHDFWLGSFLARDARDPRRVDGAVTVERAGPPHLGAPRRRAGRRRPRATSSLRRVLRHPREHRALRLAAPRPRHPARALGLGLLAQLARAAAAARRTGCGTRSPRRASREGYDGVVIGHFHHAYERREQGREFFMLGDWIERFTYLELRDGRLELKTWPERPAAEPGAEASPRSELRGEREAVRVAEVELRGHERVVDAKVPRSPAHAGAEVRDVVALAQSEPQRGARIGRELAAERDDRLPAGRGARVQRGRESESARKRRASRNRRPGPPPAAPRAGPRCPSMV